MTHGVAGTLTLCTKLSHSRKLLRVSPKVFIIGVAGDSGSGKTTFTNAIRQIFGPDMVVTITLDDYHKFDREERHRLNITPLHPDANNLTQLESDVTRLKEGKAIEKPVYNHASGTFDSPVPFPSKKIIILEGLHTLFTPTLRSLVDFSVFVDPDPEVKYEWKRQRDLEQRGYSSADVDDELIHRAPVLGIDLGTTFSAIARWNGKGPEHYNIVSGGDELQSVVYVHPDSGEILVGKEAYKRGLLDPDNVAVGIKRKMDDGGQRVHLGGRDFTPIDISAKILERLYRDVQDKFPKGVFTSRGTVVTVPYYFKAHQFENTRKAADIANIKCLDLLQEPIAASLSYAWKLVQEHPEREGEETILVSTWRRHIRSNVVSPGTED